MPAKNNAPTLPKPRIGYDGVARYPIQIWITLKALRKAQSMIGQRPKHSRAAVIASAVEEKFG